MKRPYRIVLLLGLFVAALLSLPAPWLWKQWRPYESNDLVDSSWTAGGQPYRITSRVVDRSGKPLPGVKVRMVDPPGGGGGLTDANGEWVYHPDGGLLTCSLHDVYVMEERDYAWACGPGRRGWIRTAVVKDPVRIGIEPD